MSEHDSPAIPSVPTSSGSDALVPKTGEASEVATQGAGTNGTKLSEDAEVLKDDAPVDANVSGALNDEQAMAEEMTEEKPTTIPEDNKIDSETNPEDPPTAADEATTFSIDTPLTGTKSKAAARRKSGGVPEHKSRKLNKKQSKAKLTHTDAKPGDYFYIRLKGYPLWPGIVCDESMLPATLLKTRPVTAAGPDGKYRDDYADGGPKVKDRSFAVMYLHTNEFSWIPNRDLVDLDPETVGENLKGRKDLQEAHKLAAEQHDLDYFKEVLKTFMEQREADLRAQAEEAEEAREAKAAKALKSKKAKSQKVVDDEDEDVEMPDIDAEDATTTAISNKRKAEEDGTIPQGAEPSKKLKLNLKLSSTPKAPNGTSTPKSAKDTPSTKVSKPKPKKVAPKAAATPEAVIPKEPELTTEEKRAKKEKEILFLRHKLQKGLLTRDQPPKEEEMKQMSEFVSKLEGYSELEVSIIRTTKINKVLKAILKLSSIPREDEFNFKPRSQSLLDKWNKLLATEQTTVITATNGGSEIKADVDEPKPSPVESTNGAKETVTKSVEEKPLVLKSPTPEKDEPAAVVESASDPSPEKPSEASIRAVDETTT